MICAVKKDASSLAERPTSGTLVVKGKIKSAEKLKGELETLSMFSNLAVKDGSVEAMIVESMDRQKNPYLYMAFSFGAKSAEVKYSITPEVANPDMRKLQVMKTAFVILSLLNNKGEFKPDIEDLYAKTVEAFDISMSFKDAEPLKMKYELGRYGAENTRLQGEASKLKEEKEALNHELLELGRKAETLEERVKKLESVTDSELDREVIQWVEDHSGKLHEKKFCSSFGITAQRLEERLDALSKAGVIRIV